MWESSPFLSLGSHTPRLNHSPTGRRELPSVSEGSSELVEQEYLRALQRAIDRGNPLCLLDQYVHYFCVVDSHEAPESPDTIADYPRNEGNHSARKGLMATVQARLLAVTNMRSRPERFQGGLLAGQPYFPTVHSLLPTVEGLSQRQDMVEWEGPIVVPLDSLEVFARAFPDLFERLITYTPTHSSFFGTTTGGLPVNLRGASLRSATLTKRFSAVTALRFLITKVAFLVRLSSITRHNARLRRRLLDLARRIDLDSWENRMSLLTNPSQVFRVSPSRSWEAWETMVRKHLDG